MTDESPPAGLALTFTVSSQPAFLDTAEALAARVGEHAGCTAEDARRLGQAVKQALGGLIRHPASGRALGELDVAFAGNGRVLAVEVACVVAPDASAYPIEDTLTGHGEAATMRGLVDRVEFIRDGQREFCRLTQQVRRSR